MAAWRQRRRKLLHRPITNALHAFYSAQYRIAGVASLLQWQYHDNQKAHLHTCHLRHLHASHAGRSLSAPLHLSAPHRAAPLLPTFALHLLFLCTLHCLSLCSGISIEINGGALLAAALARHRHASIKGSAAYLT